MGFFRRLIVTFFITLATMVICLIIEAILPEAVKIGLSTVGEALGGNGGLYCFLALWALCFVYSLFKF